MSVIGRGSTFPLPSTMGEPVAKLFATKMPRNFRPQKTLQNTDLQKQPNLRWPLSYASFFCPTESGRQGSKKANVMSLLDDKLVILMNSILTFSWIPPAVSVGDTWTASQGILAQREEILDGDMSTERRSSYIES